MNWDFLIVAVPIVVVLGLLWFGARAVRLFWTGLASRHWPTVQGDIVTIGVETTPIENGYLYSPTITYRYEVHGSEYEGKRIDVSTQRKYYTEAGASAVLESYLPNAKVPVYYNPKRPGDCLLRPGVSVATWIVAGLIITLLCLLGAVGLPS